MNTRKFAFVASLLSIVGLLAGSAHAADTCKVIAVNFNSKAYKDSTNPGSDSNKIGPTEDSGLIGLPAGASVPGAGVNQTENSSGTANELTVYDAINHTGSGSVASVTWAAGGNCYAWTDSDTKMLKGYLDDNNPGNSKTGAGSPTTINFSDIPFARYDIYVYMQCDSANPSGQYSVEYGTVFLNDTRYKCGSDGVAYSDGVGETAAWGSTRAETPTLGGNVIWFKDVTGNAPKISAVRYNKTTSQTHYYHRVGIAAIVIVDTTPKETAWTGFGDGSTWADGSNWTMGAPGRNYTVTFDGAGAETTYDLGNLAFDALAVASGDWTAEIRGDCFKDAPLAIAAGASFALKNAEGKTNPFATTGNDIQGTLDLGGATQEADWTGVLKDGSVIKNGVFDLTFSGWMTAHGLSFTIGPDAIVNTPMTDGNESYGELNLRGGTVATIDGGTFNNNNSRETDGNNIGNDGTDGTLRIINGGTFTGKRTNLQIGNKQGSIGVLSVDHGTVDIGDGFVIHVAPNKDTGYPDTTGVLAVTNGTITAAGIKFCHLNPGVGKASFVDSILNIGSIYKNKNPADGSFCIMDGCTINTTADGNEVLANLGIDYTLEGKGVTINTTNRNTTVGGSFAGTAPFVKQGAETLTFNGSFKNAATFQVDEGVLAMGAINQNFAKTGEGALLLNAANTKNVTSIEGVLDLGGQTQTGTTASDGSGLFENNSVISNGTLTVTYGDAWATFNKSFTVGQGATLNLKYGSKMGDSRSGELNLKDDATVTIDGGTIAMNNNRSNNGNNIPYGTLRVINGGTFKSEQNILQVGSGVEGQAGILAVSKGTINVGKKDAWKRLTVGGNVYSQNSATTGIVAMTNGVLNAESVMLGEEINGNKAEVTFRDSVINIDRIYKNKSLASGSFVLFDGATWNVTGSRSDILSDLGCTITLGEGGLTIDTDHDVTISAILSGPGKITKKGTGTLTIQGAQQFTGGIDYVAEDEESVGKVILASGASLPVGTMTEADIQKLATPTWHKLQVNPDTQRLEVVDAPETAWLGEDDGLWSEGANWSVGAPPVAKSVTIFEATETKDHGTTVYDLTNNKIPSEIDVNSGAWTTKVDQASFSGAKLKIAEGAEFALDGANGKTNPFATSGNEIQGTLDLGKATQQFEGTSSFKEGSIIKNGNVNLNFDGWMTLDNLSLTLGTNAVVQTLQAADNAYGELNIRNGSIFTIDGGTFVDKNKRSKNGNNIGNDYGMGIMRIINGGQFESPNIRVQVGAQTQKGKEATIGILSVDKGTVKIGGDSANQQLTVGGNRTDQQAAATGIVAMTNGVLSAYSVMLGDGIDGNIAQLTFKDSEIDARKIYRSKKLGDGSFVKFDGATFNTQVDGEILGALGTAYRLIGNGLTINAMHEVTSSGALNCQGPLVKTGTGTLTLGNQLTVNPDLIVREGILAFNLDSADKIPAATTSITLEGEGKVSGLPAATYKKLTIGEGAKVDESSFPNGKLTFSEIEVPAGLTVNVATPIGADFAKTGEGTLVLANCACGKALDLREGKVTLAWSDAAGTNSFSTAQDANALASTLDLGGATQTILVATPDDVLQDGFTLLNGTLNANFTGWWSMNGGRTVTIGPGATLNTGVGTASGRDKYNREGELNIRQGSVVVVDGGTLNANNDRDDSTNGNDIGNDYNADADNTATLRVINGGTFNSTANFVELGVKQGVTGILAVTNGTVNVANGDKWLSVAPGREGAATTGIVEMKDGALIAQTIVLCDASAGNTAKLTFKDSAIDTQRIYAQNAPSSDSFVIFDGAIWNVTGSRPDILTDLGCLIALGEGGLTIDTDHDVTISAILSGAGKIVKKGTGMLTLEGAQEFTGGIEFAEGAEQTVAFTTTTTITSGITEAEFGNFIVPEGMLLFTRSDGSVGVRKEGASLWTGGAKTDDWSQSSNWAGGVPNNSAAFFSNPGKATHTTYNLNSPTAVTNVTVESGDWTTDVGSKYFQGATLDLRSGASFALENAAFRTNLFSTAANANTIAGTLDLGGARQTFTGAFTRFFPKGGEIKNGDITLALNENGDHITNLSGLDFTIGQDAEVTCAQVLNVGGDSVLTIRGGSFKTTGSNNLSNGGSYFGNEGNATIVIESGSFTHTGIQLYLGRAHRGAGNGALYGTDATVNIGGKNLILGDLNSSTSTLMLTNSTLTCKYLQFGLNGSSKPGKQTVDLKNTRVRFSGFGAQKVNNNSRVKLDGVTFVDKGDHITLFPDTMPTCELGPDGILVQAQRGADHASISINSDFTGTGGMTIETPDSDFSVSLGGTPDFTGDFVFKGPGKLALSEGKAFHGNVILANGAGFRDYDPNGDQALDEPKAVLTTTGTITFDQIGQKFPGKRNRFFTATKDGVTTLYFGPKPTGLIIFNGQN